MNFTNIIKLIVLLIDFHFINKDYKSQLLISLVKVFNEEQLNLDLLIDIIIINI